MRRAARASAFAAPGASIGSAGSADGPRRLSVAALRQACMEASATALINLVDLEVCQACDAPLSGMYGPAGRHRCVDGEWRYLRPELLHSQRREVNP